MHLLESPHPRILVSLCFCVLVCIHAYLHSRIFSLLCPACIPGSSYPEVHVCLVVSLYPHILISSVLQVLACILASLHLHIPRFIRALLYLCILISSYPQVHVCLLVSSHPNILASSGFCVLASIYILKSVCPRNK